MNKKLLGIILIVVLALGLCSIALAADVVPAPPQMKLTVAKSPLTIFPPMIIYTAQLSYMPPVNTILTAKFYHVAIDSTSTSAAPIYLGTAAFDKTGKAVLNKQIMPGAYSAYATSVIYGITIYSNKVEYKVP